MKKVVAFLGSPRPNGYTAKLVERVLEGAKAAGAEVVTYSLNDEGIKGCQGCFYCRNHPDCATKDKLYPMYEDIKSACGIVGGFPIYFGTVSGQANGDDNAFADAIRTNNSLVKMWGWELTESLLVYGDVAPGYTIPVELFDRAYEAGRKLVE